MQPLMAYRELYQATLHKWGVEAQYDQAVEECAELIASHLAAALVYEEELAGPDVVGLHGAFVGLFACCCAGDDDPAGVGGCGG